MRALRDRSYTARQLCLVVHCHVRTAARTLESMRVAGLVHIESWEHSRGAPLPVFRLGFGDDAVRPPAYTNAEKMRIYRASIGVEEKDFKAARRRQLRRKIKVDPLTAAFFGVKR